jgi:hypothetical protein
MSDSHPCTRNPTQAVVKTIVSYAGENTWCHPGNKTLRYTADGGRFNGANKIVYGVQMLNNVREHNLMVEEIFSKKNRMADDGTLCKTLFYDIT